MVLPPLHLSDTERPILRKLLGEYQDVFLLDGDSLGLCDVHPHKINTGNVAPIKQAARRLPHQRQLALKTIIDDLLQQGIISPSSSPWASPVVLVSKKDGSLRLCIDYQKLNKVTCADAYPLPRIDDTVDSLSGCSLFSTFDLASGYWQLTMEETDCEKQHSQHP